MLFSFYISLTYKTLKIQKISGKKLKPLTDKVFSENKPQKSL